MTERTQTGTVLFIMPSPTPVTTSQITEVKAELARIDQQRSLLLKQLEALEKEAIVSQNEAQSAWSEAEPLRKQAKALKEKFEKKRKQDKAADKSSAAASSSDEPPAKKKRGSKAADDEPARGKAKESGKAPKPPAVASSRNSSSKSTASSDAAASGGSKSTAAPVGKFVDGIGIPSHELALKAAGDEALQHLTFKFPQYRVELVAKAHAAKPVGPNETGEQLSYLMASAGGDANEYEGFIVYKEVWGKRGKYDVELEQLSFPYGENLAVAKKLLDAMISRLKGEGTISVKLAEKVKPEKMKIWEDLQFHGYAGSDTCTRSFP